MELDSFLNNANLRQAFTREEKERKEKRRQLGGDIQPFGSGDIFYLFSRVVEGLKCHWHGTPRIVKIHQCLLFRV